MLESKAGKFYAWTRWGRVGEDGQSALEGPLPKEAAIKSFEAKFKSKSKHVWTGASGSYPGGKAKQYTVIFEAASAGQSAKLEAAATGSPVKAPEPVTYAKPTITGKLAEFTELVTSDVMFKAQLSTLGVDTTKMPLGDITQRTIDDGFSALLQLEKELTKKKPSMDEVNRLSALFYVYIPHAFGRNRPPPLKIGDITAKKDMLNVLSDVSANQTSKKKSRAKSKSKKAAAEPAPIDLAYESLGAKLVLVKESSSEFKLVQKYTENTQGYRKCTVVDVFRVDDAADAARFETHADMDNRKLLWHGTNVAVVAAILQSGLKIMPHSGGRVGSGVYLASENGKSAGYCTAQGHDGVMFLCEAALGDQKHITQDGVIGWNDKDPLKGTKYNSCLAVGQTEPNPKDDKTVNFDGRPVTVPQGKVVANPELAGGTSSFSQSEYLVYDAAQVRIRYVIKMKFETAGGSWH